MRFFSASASARVRLFTRSGFALQRRKRVLADGRRIEGNFELRIRLLTARNRPEQHDGVFLALEARGHRLRRIFQNADDAEHRRGINAFAARLVI